MNSKLELIFKNQQDRKTRISIDEPRADLTEVEIQTAMNSIIAENIFNTSGGDLVAISGARVVTTDIQEFEV
ncbi:DUF2922 domain-containing protein [Clostridium sp. D2Q-11]|uniref:DUF2922 domain-containing protein n=1 Tax=Anaeromonas frigoriresistens TaxID=2683708 RepID=A0A942Z8Q9_9FIRM|nr:DUF2922 domain-containing protein [Anaeromonas frigoriresistens]MBS4538160.1 DUF2922 domain-containing protein [Anaeromonas frigoriresistens]